MNYEFEPDIDPFNDVFYTLNLTGTVARNISAIRGSGGGRNNSIASLLFPFINVETRASGRFQTDLTPRDDVLLAFMSLVLLLIIDSMFAAFLLRSRHGAISNFGFSVKQAIELIRDFSFRGIIPRRRRRSGKKINFPLLLTSILILLSTLGLEVAVIFLTVPKFKSVFNTTATFRLMQPIIPEWRNVRFHARVSLNRPCESFTLEGVEQASTGINGCTESSLEPGSIFLFEKNTEPRDMTIISDFHDYGAEHFVSIGNLSANYSTRVVLFLGDKRSRFMRSAGTSQTESQEVEFIHVQLLAYSFSLYRKGIGDDDPDMNIERLSNLRFFFDDTQEGPPYDVLRLPGKAQMVNSRRYVTTLSGVIPDGTPVLRIAQHHFRGAAAVIVTGPDEEDLFLEDGIDSDVAEVWQEQIRAVNWLSLFIAISALFVALVVCRIFLKPVSTPDIAAMYVRAAVGADVERAPMELSGTESTSFQLGLRASDVMQRIGAETGDEETHKRDEEYM